MPGFFESKKKIVIPDTLIPMGFPETPRLVVGHFVSYDRARIKVDSQIMQSLGGVFAEDFQDCFS